MTETLIHTINVNGDGSSYRLRSRRIWEALYHNTQAKNFQHFDNFLIDLRLFEEQFDNQLDNETLVEFYWSHAGDGDHTKVFAREHNYNLMDTWLWEESYRIEFLRKDSTINFYKVETQAASA